jgi:hypothetical protein
VSTYLRAEYPMSTESISTAPVPISAPNKFPRAVPCEYSGHTPEYICVHTYTVHTPAACLRTCRMQLVLTPILYEYPLPAVAWEPSSGSARARTSALQSTALRSSALR